MGKLKRLSAVLAGYDCIAHPCGKNGCGTWLGSSHGRHGDEWEYAVTDGEFALSLRVYTHQLEGARLLPWAPPEGASLDAHAPFPIDDDQVREGHPGRKCGYLAQGRCYGGFSSALIAGEFFQAYGQPAFEQAESFWVALENEWRRMRAVVEADKSASKRCPCCEGDGLIKQQAPASVRVPEGALVTLERYRRALRKIADEYHWADSPAGNLARAALAGEDTQSAGDEGSNG